MRLVIHWAFSIILLAISSGTLSAIQINATAVLQEEEPRVDTLGDPLPSKALLRMGTKRFVHQGGGPSMITLSKDEAIIFSMDDNWMIAWETATGKQLWKAGQNLRSNIRVGAAGYGIRPMTIMPNSGKLVSSGTNGEMVFWDPSTGEMETVKSPAVQRWKSIDISPDSKLMALGSNKALWVCDPAGDLVYEIANKPKKPLDQVNGDDRLMFGGDFSYARFSPDGKVLALINSEKPKTIQLLKAVSGESLRDIATGDRVVRMDFSPDGSQIVATERDNSARLYDIESGESVWEFVIPPISNAEAYTSDVDFRPDGKQIAVGAPIGADYRIRLLNAEDGKETGSLEGCGWKPWPMQYTRDSKVLISSGWDSVIRKWDIQSATQLPLPGDAVRASSICAMSGDGKLLTFTDGDGKIRLVDIKSGRTLKTFFEDGVKEMGQAVFNRPGTQLAVGYSTETEIQVVIWDVASEQRIHSWSWNKGRDPHSSVEALAFSQDGNRIAAAVFRQSAAYVFDLSRDQQIAKVKHGNVYGMDISKDGSTLFTAGWDKTIRVWDCESGEQIQSLTVTPPAVEGRRVRADTRAYGLKLSHDEKMIATCDMTRKIRFFDRNLNPISVLDDPGWFTFGAIQFSHNDLWIGAGTGDGARVFDVLTGDKVFDVDEHDEYIYTVDFGAKDRTMISGGSDGVCYLWDILPETSSSSSRDTIFASLVGNDGVKAYAVFHQLAAAPEEALELLETKLGEQVKLTVDSSEIAKWVTALGSDNERMIEKAKMQLLKFGPAAYDPMIASLNSDSLSDQKKKSLSVLANQIHRGYRRATILLAELDTPGTDLAIAELMKHSKTKMWKLMLFEAKKHRSNFMKNHE